VRLRPTLAVYVARRSANCLSINTCTEFPYRQSLPNLRKRNKDLLGFLLSASWHRALQKFPFLGIYGYTEILSLRLSNANKIKLSESDKGQARNKAAELAELVDASPRYVQEAKQIRPGRA
jgi:hypothetical protein